jgi:hypothetical protein
MIEIETATKEDVIYVASHLHPADELEITTAGGQAPQEALEWGRTVAFDSLAVFPIYFRTRQDPVAIFGIVSDEERSPGMGVLWMVSTPMLLTTSKDILQQAPRWISWWLDRFPAGLHNLVDSRNERHVRWLKKLGAKFSKGPQIRGVQFDYFVINRRDQ